MKNFLWNFFSEENFLWNFFSEEIFFLMKIFFFDELKWFFSSIVFEVDWPFCSVFRRIGSWSRPGVTSCTAGRSRNSAPTTRTSRSASGVIKWPKSGGSWASSAPPRTIATRKAATLPGTTRSFTGTLAVKKELNELNWENGWWVEVVLLVFSDGRRDELLHTLRFEDPSSEATYSDSVFHRTARNLSTREPSLVMEPPSSNAGDFLFNEQTVFEEVDTPFTGTLFSIKFEKKTFFINYELIMN